jgi:hypothetical protein
VVALVSFEVARRRRDEGLLLLGDIRVGIAESTGENFEG